MLDPCVKAILCALSAGPRAAIRAALQLAIAAVNLQIAAVSAILAQAEIITVPWQVAKDGLEVVKGLLTGNLSLLPGELFAGCPALGELSIGFALDVSDVTQSLDAQILELRDKLAYVDSLNAKLVRLQAEVALYESIVDEIVDCP